MKYVFNTIIFVLMVFCASAQTFTLQPKDVTVNGENKETFIINSVMINNTTNDADSMFEWKVIAYSAPAEWQVTFCDPMNCYPVENGDSSTFSLKKGKGWTHKIDVIPNSVSGMGTFRFVLSSLLDDTNADTISVTTYAFTTSITELNIAQMVTLYPNPAANSVTINTEKIAANTTIKVIDIAGKTAIETKVEPGIETAIDCSTLSNGIYMVQFETNGMVATQKLVINK